MQAIPTTSRPRIGEVQVLSSLARAPDALSEAFAAAGLAAGYSATDDYNGAQQEGFGRWQATIRDGRRCSASVAYLRPRIFSIPPAVPISAAKVEPAAEPKQIRRKANAKRETREIPVSQFGRVRTLTSYGMTRAQVAELYGVAVDEIDRIIRRPS